MSLLHAMLHQTPHLRQSSPLAGNNATRAQSSSSSDASAAEPLGLHAAQKPLLADAAVPSALQQLLGNSTQGHPLSSGHQPVVQSIVLDDSSAPQQWKQNWLGEQALPSALHGEGAGGGGSAASHFNGTSTAQGLSEAAGAGMQPEQQAAGARAPLPQQQPVSKPSNATYEQLLGRWVQSVLWPYFV